MRDTAGSAAAPAARCRKFRRGSFISILPSLISLFDHLVSAREQRWRHFEAQRLSGLLLDFGVTFHRRHQHTDPLHSVLRMRRNRPRGRRAAEQRDELAAFHHSITSSASASSLGGMSRPSALAATTLMTNSYFVGISTGKSPGFAPLRMGAT